MVAGRYKKRTETPASNHGSGVATEPSIGVRQSHDAEVVGA